MREFAPSELLDVAILAQSWPTWAQVLSPATGFHCTTVQCVDQAFSSFWTSLCPVLEPLPPTTGFPLLDPGSRPKILFLSGPLDFVFEYWVKYYQCLPIMASLDLNQSPSSDLISQGLWFQLQHSDYGGVTTGIWWFGTTINDLTLPDITPSHRRLKHALSDTERGRRISPPECLEGPFEGPRRIPSSSLLHPGGFLPIMDLNTSVVCPSVFSPTGWVRRRLTMQELARCFDIPDVLASSWETSYHQQLPFSRMPFTVAAPTKLLAPLVTRVHTSFGAPLTLNLELSRVYPPVGPQTSRPCSPVSADEATCSLPLGFGRLKAAKNDDADIPVGYWDNLVWRRWSMDEQVQAAASEYIEQHQESPLTALRKLGLRFWWRTLYRSFRRFMQHEYGTSHWWLRPPDPQIAEVWSKTMAAARDCLTRAAAADWWEWHGGSRLFFWRWPPESRVWARDGLPVHVMGTLPAYRKPQPREPDDRVRDQVRSKLAKFRTRQYINPGNVASLTSYFTVPKGDGDIRLVFDGTKSGLNASLWAPSFVLPTINSLLHAVEPGTWMADIDVGEQFYNYCLDPTIQPYCGVDLSPYFDDATAWELWTRCVMGLKTSPYGCIRMEMLGDEVAKGCYASPDNPFHFDEVRLNLPGSPSYDPTQPWVFKYNSKTGRIAGDVKTYVDDKRATGASWLDCIRTTRRAASFLTYLGEQDASRKRVPPSLRAGAWSGSVCHSDAGRVTVMVTQDKWDKARQHITTLRSLQATTNVFNFKSLEQIRGFLVYVVRTYPGFSPYLKGIHLTLDSWRPGRGEDGWKMANQVRHHIAENDVSIDYSGTPPEIVTGVPRLASDLEALDRLFSSTTPPRRVVRSTGALVVLYGFADASGSGFGSSLLSPNGLHFRYGLWGRDLSHQSSNYRELRNLVDTVDYELLDQFPVLSDVVDAIGEAVVGHAQPGLELFLFTDNSVAEGAFFRGTSSNPKLFDLILRLKQLELQYSLHIHIIHIAGRRMLAQGTDGLSRGDLCNGVMRGDSLLSFVPLHLSPLERAPGLLDWCQLWLGECNHLCPLSPYDWFIRGHGVIGSSFNTDGVWLPQTLSSSSIVFLWHPPPAAAEVALEELCFSRHKRPFLAHIFLCPRLFTHTWRKRLCKFADLTFYLPAGLHEPFWPSNAYEPLMVGIFLPHLASPPWCLRGSPSLQSLEQELRAEFSRTDPAEHLILRRLWDLY